MQKKYFWPIIIFNAKKKYFWLTLCEKKSVLKYLLIKYLWVSIMTQLILGLLCSKFSKRKKNKEKNEWEKE